MSNIQNSFNFNNSNTFGTSSETAVKTFMIQVFAWMSGALMITALTSYLFGNISSLLSVLYRIDGDAIIGMTPIGWAVVFAPLALVMVMSFAFNKLSFPALVGVFMLYSAVNGMSLSTIFLRYEMSLIGVAFAITAGMFGVMAVMGFVTKADLSKFGSILFMGLIGIVIASLVNMFVGSSTLDYIISFVGVAVFTGLTAYDVQTLKNIATGNEYGEATMSKLAVMGALRLYLDFINLFLMILRLLGRRD
ncbi:MAG: Bax inhibitor-1/YccA family protein [Bacteroidetes bacterium]|nr:Bax inhibitor-1/YccA family protein [Bacteroidota bacterium]